MKYDSVKREKAPECLCISPMFMASDNCSETALRLNRSKYSKNIIFSYLNINSVRDKFDSARAAIVNYVDIFIDLQRLTSLFLLLNLQLMDLTNLLCSMLQTKVGVY